MFLSISPKSYFGLKENRNLVKVSDSFVRENFPGLVLEKKNFSKANALKFRNQLSKVANPVRQPRSRAP
jgi:hypothetical protein